MKEYQTAVIGGGPGGYIAAIRCAQLGMKTVIIEKRDMGGTCLNRGCIPTKALLHSAEIYEEVKNCKALGIEIDGEVGIKYKKMAKRKDKVVKQLRSGVESLVAGHGADIVRGEAVMTGKNTFKVNDEEYKADKIIVAAGSVPAYIPIKGADKEGVLNSDGVLNLEECPESVAIIGGGVIGVEFATLFNDLGKKTTIIEMMPSILYGNDSDVCASMTSIMTDKGVDIHTNAKVVEIKDGMTVVYEENGEANEVTAEIVIMAIGRTPESKDLNLEAAGVKVNAKGFIEVDNMMQTNVENIYAIGDVTGVIQLAHVATAQGIVAAHNAAGDDRIMRYDAVPNCIYTTPEIACVGLTEEKAAERGIKVKTGKFNVSGNGRSLAINCSDGFAKIVCDEESGCVIGCHIVAPHATEMICEATLAIENGLKVEDIADTIHAHPTVSEIIMEAAHDVDGRCCHKMP